MNVSEPRALPEPAIGRLMRPLVRFLHVEAVGGLVLLTCTAAALTLANSRYAADYARFWQTPVMIAAGEFGLSKPLLLWVNDGLMTLFFFVVGLEIKRELVSGELRDPRKAALPVVAALGGMVVPAAIYLALRLGRAGERGWGIPMATDIAFAVGLMALLGRRVPLGLKIMLLTLAIADDIGAVVIIAAVYSTDIAGPMLGLAALGFLVVKLLHWLGVRRVVVYVVVGAAIWLAFLKSGVHPTVAGVLLGLLTPASAWVGDRSLLGVVQDAVERLRGEPRELGVEDRAELLGRLRVAAREAVSPLERLQSALHVWVAYVIMPVFALANAGVKVEPGVLSNWVALAVAAGLLLGKPLGIVLFSWLAVRVGLARLPAGVDWKAMAGAGCLAGVGFTMSLFIAGLALEGELLEAGKAGTLTGSAISALLGLTLLLVFLRKPPAGATTK